MGLGVIVIFSTNLTKAQWDALLVQVNAFITANPGLGLGLEKTRSVFQENPP
jgi:hypothetical protein